MQNHLASTIEMKSVSKSFAKGWFGLGRARAVQKLNCQFRSGECTGILGSNGAGKTTSLRLILGLIQPDKGKVSLQTGANFGYMPETARLPGCLTPWQVLSTQLALYKRPKAKATLTAALHEMGLFAYRKTKISQLSKGLERRVSWLLATIHEPDIIVLDEPFSGLDPFVKQTVQEKIHQLKQAGKTIILCSHEFDGIQDLCDRVYVIKRGKLLSLDLKNPPLQTSEFNFPGIKYTLSLSGVHTQDLEKIASSHKLRKWDELEQENFLCVLKFSEYTVASRWLKTALELGFIVLRFGNEVSLQDKTVRSMFDWDEKGASS